MTKAILDCVEIDPASEPSAVVIWLHGLGADGHDFEPIVPELRLPGDLPIRWVFPHAPLRSVTINAGMVMRAWFDILDLHLDRHVDMDNFLASGELVENLIRRERDAGMPADRLVLAGFSQGGAVALHTGLRYPERLAGIIALSTYLPTAASLAEEGATENRNTPIFMAHGTDDPVVPLANAVSARQTMTRLKYRVTWNAYPMQHAVCPEEIGHIRKWLLETLNPTPRGN